MKHSCNTCNYETNDKSNFNKHIKSVSHDKLISENANGKVPRSYDCKCSKKFSHPSSLSRHKKTCNGIDLIGTLNKLNSKLNDYDKLHAKLDEYKKENDKFKKQLLKTNKSQTIINNPIININYIKQFYHNAPPLKQLEEYVILDNYDKDKDSTLIKKLVNYQEQNLLTNFLGDFIILIYKKEDPQKQSLWSSDTARLSYIIKELLGNNESSWNQDPKATKIIKYIIDPMLKYINDQINDYCKNDDNLVDLLDPIYEESQNNSNIYRRLGEITSNIEKEILHKDIVKYITPYFYVKQSTIKTIDQY